MSTDLQAAKLETAQVLAVEVIMAAGTSPVSQLDLIEKLTSIVEKTDAFVGANVTGKVTRVSIPKGIALVFKSTPDAPIRCAIQIGKALGDHPELRVRMGIHRGPVNDVQKDDDASEISGAGMKLALRVMECGDPGHILLTREVAGLLGMYRYWEQHLQHLGDYEIKGERLSVVNLCTGEVGKPGIPSKLATLPAAGVDSADRVASPRQRMMRWGIFIAAGLFVAFLLPGLIKRIVRPAPVEIISTAPEKSIAVLPFENFTGDADTAVFADGIQDEILSDLAKLADLKVISRTSVLQYKNAKARNLREIGQQLGVAHILEGSVQRSNDRIRVTAQLIDARTDAHLWAQTYDRVIADVFAIQTDIAKSITEQLKVQLSPSERAALAQSATTDLVADRLYREASRLMNAGSNPDGKGPLLESIPLLEEAVQRDPKFMRAYSVLVTAHLDLYWQGFDHTETRLAAARNVIERATATDPESGDTHLSKALYSYRAFRDYDQARAELEKVRTSRPNDAGIYIILAAIDRRQGRWNEALRNFNRGIELDPRNFRFLLEDGFTYQAMRLYKEASELYDRALTIRPRDAFTLTQRAMIPFLEQGDAAPLRAKIAEILNDDPTAATAIAGANYYSALAARDQKEVTRALESIRAEGLRDDYNNSLWSRDWFVGLSARTFGDTAAARTAFTAARAIEEKNVREQPEYAAAWSRLGLIEAALGHKEAALKASRKACELLPVTTDSFDGVSYRVYLALSYLWSGEKEAALRELEEIAKLPAGISYGELRLYPQWDALRGDPRFEAIVSSLAPTGH